MDFKEKMFELRKASGLSQEEVAGRLEVSRQSVSKWESGQSSPEMEKLPAIAELFQVSLDYLLKASEIDDLSIKTMQLEAQQKEIFSQQKRVQNRNFLILSSVIALLAALITYMLGRYIMFPDVGEGYTYLGKMIMYGGLLVIVAVTAYVNWRYRARVQK